MRQVVVLFPDWRFLECFLVELGDAKGLLVDLEFVVGLD